MYISQKWPSMFPTRTKTDIRAGELQDIITCNIEFVGRNTYISSDSAAINYKCHSKDRMVNEPTVKIISLSDENYANSGDSMRRT
jgi:hypothetical protein